MSIKGENDMEDILYTVKEAADRLKTNTDYVYALIKKGYLKCLKLKSYKIRKSTLEQFLEKYEGYDLSDLDDIKELNFITAQDMKKIFEY